MANWSNPTLTSLYTDFLTELKARDEDLAKQFDGQTVSNLATGTIRWSSSANRWQKWTGSAWGELTTTYALTGLSTTGNASIGGTLTVTGAAALNGGGTSTTPATADNTTAIATTAYVKAQGYAALASPTFTGTPAAPTAAVGTNTTQLATCAYVNAEISNDAVLKTGSTMTGALQVPSGTVSANGIQVGAAGTGLYSPGTGILALAADGTEVLRVTAANGLALGSTGTNVNVGFRHTKNITGGTTAWAQLLDGLVQTDVTSVAAGLGTSIGTAASTVLTSLVHFQAATGTLGASTVITNQIGFSASSTLAGATNDYGFYGAIGAGTGNWNCYMVGTAPNYFAGQVQLGAGSVTAPSLSTNGDTDTGIYFPAAGLLGFTVDGAIAGAFDSFGNLRLYNAVGTFYTNITNAPTANRTLALPDGNVTLVAGTMVPTTGTGATGTWGISISQNAATATTATNCSRSVVAGNGMTGGGALTADRTVALGTPGSITDASTNSVSADSHTHALAESSVRLLLADGTTNGVGTYAWCATTAASGAKAPNSTIAGSAMRYADAEDGTFQTAAPSGTWRCMGATRGPASNYGTFGTTLWLRIS
jgi:hypothetical protein